MNLSLRNRFYLYILPLAVILPFLLYSLAAPYGQLNTLFGSYETDTAQALNVEKVEAGIHQEYLVLFHLITESADSSADFTKLEQLRLESVRQTIDQNFELLLGSIDEEEEESRADELKALEEIKNEYQIFTQKGRQSLTLHNEGKQLGSLAILTGEMNKQLETVILPNIEKISASETHDVENNLPLLVGIISRFGVFPIPGLADHMQKTSIEFRNALLAQELSRLIDSLQIAAYLQMYEEKSIQPVANDQNIHTIRINTVESEISETIDDLKTSVAIDLKGDASGEKAEEVAKIVAIEEDYQELKGSLESVLLINEQQGDSSSVQILSDETRTLLKDSLQPKIGEFVIQEEIDRGETVQSLRQFLQTMVNVIYLLCLLVFLVGLFGIWSLSRKIIDPIVLLRDISGRVTRGDFSARINISSKDEIGELAQAFNTMIMQLHGLYSALESKIQSRTSQLSEKLKELEQSKKATLNILEDLNNEKVKLQIRDAQLADAQHAGRFGSYTWTLATNKIFWSKEMFSLMGLPEDSVTPTFEQFMQMVLPDDRETMTKSMSKLITSPEPYESEFKVKFPDQTVHWIRSRGRTEFVNGKPSQLIGTFQDITKEKEVDRMKTEFISLASHQLRTPLSAIKWFGEMLLNGDAGQLEKEQKEYVQNIYDSNTRMVELVNGLLNISRIESGRLMVEPVPTDMTILVNQVVTELKPKTTEKKQKLIISINEELTNVNVDPKLIQQVYVNLLTNAIKYTPSGGEISIFVSKKGDQIVSQVTDTGYGIPKGDYDKVFRKFYRGDNITKIETDGTGLGLYLIKAIIESSGGKIWFRSAEGKGTTFWFSIPIAGMVAHKGEVSLNS